MTNKKFYISALLVAVTTLASISANAQVSVTKRKHLKGYSIELFGKKKAQVEENKTIETAAPSEKVEFTDVPTIVVRPVVETPTLTESTTPSIESVIANVDATAKSANTISTKISPVKSSSKIEKQLKKEQSKITVAKNKVEKQMAKKRRGGGIDTTALILCIFLGGLGVHRFYMGYTWQGIVQLLTGGGCGVWALIDLIRIITGDLQSK